MNSHNRLLKLAVLAAIVLPGSPIAAQTQSRRDESPVSAARQRRDGGDLAGAADLLRPYVARHPAQLDAAMTLAQVLYWLKDNSGARRLYEETLVQHPESTALRLDYGQMLLETSDHPRLREVVTPAVADPGGRSRAEALLGRSAYWQGDLNAARRHFRAAVDADASNADAQSGLREIEAGTGLWLRLGTEAVHDDQPLDRRGVVAEVGWYPAPVTTMAVRAGWARLHSNDAVSLTTPSAVLRITHYAAGIRSDLEVEGGTQGRTGGGAEAIGRLGIGLRVSPHVRARASLARDVYLNTLASIETPVTTRTARAALALDHPKGWFGEAALQRQWYPDANRSSAAHAWLLAPILHHDRRQLQVGYSVSTQTADESRFVPASPRHSTLASDGRTLLDGRYAPYYTPDHVVTHAILVAGMARGSSSVTVRASGSYGFRATENAPALELRPGPGVPTVVRTSAERSFKPWTGRASLEFAASPTVTVAITGEASRTAFYKTATAGVQILWRSGGK